MHEVSLDWRAFAFLLLACVGTAVLFGLAPAVTAMRLDLRAIAYESGGRTTTSRAYKLIRDGLVVLEVAFAFVLALAAGLVVREITRLRHVDVGMVTERVLTLHDRRITASRLVRRGRP